MSDIDTIMRTAPVIPVIVIDEAEHAVPLAEALVAGGLRVLEVTLRTPAALEAIRAMKQSNMAPTASAICRPVSAPLAAASKMLT